ncbi:MAG: PAS domain S-box protein [Myxococcales bacterium]|nr:PAS domain S-box protein [Myxococcales bacterium]
MVDSLLWEEALEQASDSIELLDEEIRIVWVNRAFERLHGRLRASVIGRTPAALQLGNLDDAPVFRQAEAAILRGEVWRGEARYGPPGAAFTPVELIASPLHDRRGRFRGYLAIKRDLSQREQRDRELVGLLEALPVGVAVHQHGALRYVNRTMLDIMGEASEGAALGRSMFEWLHPADHQLVRERMAVTDDSGRLPVPTDMRVRQASGAERWVRISPMGVVPFRGEPCFCVSVLDLTQERREREATASLERLRTIGGVAAGVAHEINNPLTWLLGALDELSRELPDGRGAELAKEAQLGGQRIRDVVRDLALFTSGRDSDAGRCEVGEVVRSAVALSRRTIEAVAEVQVESPGRPLWVRGSTSRLGQVVLNLVLNAAGAIDDRGRVTLRWWREGAEVVLEVEDDGVGMDEQTRARAFEPFFTTRRERGGTGLGLAMCQNIVTSVGGRMVLSSAPGEGTRARVHLACVTAPEDRLPVEARLSPCRILVVEDQLLVQKALVRRLRGVGHRVAVADDGEQALAIVASGAVFDLILCDVMMPRKDGLAVYRELCVEHPAMARRVLFMTGAAFTDEARAFLESLASPWLVKPFDDVDFARAAAAILDAVATD